MMFRNHLIVAAAGFATLVKAMSGEFQLGTIDLVVAGLLTLTGTVLPDIDTPHSRIGRTLPFISYPIKLVFGHRGISHSLIVIALIVFAAIHYDVQWLLWIAFGYAMHLVGDYLTDSGIPALWPYKKRFRFIVFGSTNSISEPLILLAYLLLCAGIWVWVG